MTKPREKLSPENEPQLARDGPAREEIELRAYQIYVERGCAHGLDVEDWLQAERELVVEKYGKPVQKAKAAAV
jgi:Protein of unknown function (DUF2934)